MPLCSHMWCTATRRLSADAYLHIKYHVATYESAVRPSRVARKP